MTNVAEQPQGAAVKFTYPSGSRPLEGYTIKRGVGRGGFGEVYYATSDGGKEVALKLIRRNLEVELRGVVQCLNLKHPHLVGLYDTRKDEHGDAWVVMEYVRGGSLEDAIERFPSGMPIDEALWWFRGIAAGVAYLHDQGIVHRDLKPGNIFNDEGVVKIGDYGLSKFISASRRSGQTESVGTVHYMAPEIANGRYGKEIDIYALGILLYEMITGRVPFEGESVGEVLMKHLTAEPDLGGLVEPYRSVIAGALTKDPQKRFSTVAELLAALPGGAEATNATAFAIPTNGAAVNGSKAALPRLAGAAMAAAPLPRIAAAANEEPIWRAVRQWFAKVQDAWVKANFPPVVQVILILLGLITLISTYFIWIPFGMVFGPVYLIYFIIRAIAMPAPGGLAQVSTPGPRQNASSPPLPRGGEGGSSPAPSSPARQPGIDLPPPMPPPRPLRRSERLRYERALFAWPVKPARQKVTELLGSLLLSAGVATAMSVVMSVMLQLLERVPVDAARLGWLALVGTAGAWGILIPAKFWEGTHGEPILRRFVLLCVGLLLGLLAFVFQEAFVVKLPELMSYPALGAPTGGTPLLALYLAYFGFLLPILRWWRQADPLRRSRFSLWSISVCVIWAGLLGLAWQFPQPWGLMAAATIAISVQLAAPWLEHQRRFARCVV